MAIENLRRVAVAVVNLQQIRIDHAIRLPTILAICAVGLAAVYLELTRLASLYPDLVNPDLFRFFDLNEEANLPTWFSALLWQIAALLAFCVAQWHRARGYTHTAYWLGMIPLFLFLSLDEAAKVHETIGDMIGSKVEITGALRVTYPWVLFGLTLVALVGLAYARLLILLRRRFALLLVMSAVLFLLGAVVVESIGASVEGGSIERFPFGQTWPQMIAYEETLEMLGAILLIHTLLRILALNTSPYSVRGMVRQARQAKE